MSNLNSLIAQSNYLQNEINYGKKVIEQAPEGNLVIPKLRDKNSFIQEWTNADYQRSNLYPEKLIYPTVIPNLKVRSKAEADWISRLVHFGIPLRYEELIISNQVALHPDITGLNITTLTPVYIEHQGGWDNDDYIRNLEGRSLLLKQAGIIPWKNLIITTETRSQPLDINWIDELIQYFFM